ncbi:cell division protein FtsA [Psychrilyobacter atlanticus]|uniref:cell division protein FtsA n=1 Tax=Psychrilyobacter atlanticus TaxID=271091 RepID=UPI000413FDE1|nr:cell division protein FtsA [Psychrilyobacter atlanticus]
MMRRIRTGIDIGSSKTTIIVGELYDSGKNIKVLGQTIVPSNGIKKGEIIDGELFSRTLRLGKERLEDKLGVVIKKATIGVSGSDIKSSTTEIEYKLSDEDIEVTEDHCDQIFEISKEKVVKDDEQVIAKEIYNYRVDESGIMKNPVGKVGNKLKVNVHLIRIPKLKVKKIVETLNKAKIEVDSLIYNGEASSKATLKKIDKVNGVALVDIGYGLTEITIFKNNRLINTNVIPIGGMHYVNDLKYVLELNQEVVKNLLLEIKNKDIDEKITVSYLENGESLTKTFEVRYLREIMDARTDEILEYISKSIEASGYKEYLKNGVVLAGGVVGDYGILEKLKALLDYDIRIGTTIKIDGMTTTLKNPACITGMGVLLTALEDEYSDLQKTNVEDKVEEEKEKEKIEIVNKVEKKEAVKKKAETRGPSKFKKWLGNFI